MELFLKFVPICATLSFCVFGNGAPETSPTVVTTGVEVCNEVSSVEWRIINWVTVQRSEQLVNEQKFEFVVGKSPACQTKWLIGLKRNGSVIGVYFQLIENSGNGTETPTKYVVKLKYNNHSYGAIKRGERILVKNEEVLVEPSYIGFNRTEQNSAHFLHANKTVIMNIQIETSQQLGKVLSSSDPSTLDVTASFNKIFFSKLQNDFETLLQNASSADVKIVCEDGKEFLVHKVFLSARCPQCLAPIGSEIANGTGETDVIQMNHISGKTFEILLHYFYTGKILPAWEDEDNIVDFISASKRLQLTEVLEMLDKAIGTDMKTKYNIQLLNAAKFAGLHNAESELLRKIVKRSVSAKNSDELLQLFTIDSAKLTKQMCA